MAKAQDSYEPDNTAADAKVITNGQTQNRSIHQAGNVDWAKFTIGASGASNVRIQTDGASGDTEMWLYGPNSSTTQKDYDDDDGNGAFSLITQASLAAGTYYIRITEYGNNGTVPAYTLRATWTDGSAGQADLTKESDRISRTSGTPGDTFVITHRVRNGGTAPSGATKINYYVSRDSRSTAAAAKVGERDLTGLGAGAVSGDITFPWTAPANLPAGNYFIGYWIDGPQSVAESNENNNIWWWDNITIQGANWQSEAVNWRVDYGNNWTKSGTITKPGATQVRVRLSQIRTENGIDRLRSDAGDNWTGNLDNVTSGAKAGNAIQLTLTSDGSVTGYFIIERVEWLGTSTGPATKAGDLFNFGAGGTVSGPTQSGVTLTFTRVSGSGAIPGTVTSGANGAWSKSGFAPGTTYRATPSKTGYTFNPASRDFSSADNALNFTASDGLVALSNGQTVSGLSGAQGSTKYYQVTVPSGQTALAVKISGGTGDCDLYVRYANLPTLTEYNARPYLSGNLELVTQPLPAAGTWYIMLRGYSAYSGVSLQVEYSQDMLTTSLLSGLAGALGYRLDDKYSHGRKPLTYLSAGWTYGIEISLIIYTDLADYTQVTYEGWNGDWVTLWGRANGAALGASALPVTLGLLEREFSSTDLPDREFPWETSIFGGTIGPLSVSALNTSDLSFSPGDISFEAVEANASWWACTLTTGSISVEVRRWTLDAVVANSIVPGLGVIQVVNSLKTQLISSVGSNSSIVWALPASAIRSTGNDKSDAGN